MWLFNRSSYLKACLTSSNWFPETPVTRVRKHWRSSRWSVASSKPPTSKNVCLSTLFCKGWSSFTWPIHIFQQYRYSVRTFVLWNSCYWPPKNKHLSTMSTSTLTFFWLNNSHKYVVLKGSLHIYVWLCLCL